MDAKDESSCSQAIRTRRLTTLLTGVMCATRTNTLILGQSLILTLKTSFSKQNNHTSEESNQLLLDVVTWTAIIWMTDRLPAVGYIFHKSVPCAKMRHPPGRYVYVIWMWIDWYRYMKFGGEWAKRTSHKLHILSSRLIIFSINHIHIQMTCLSFLNLT